LAHLETREAQAIERLAADLTAHGGDPKAIRAASIDMSPAYLKGVETPLPNAAVTFDKFHVIAHASHALDLTRRAEQKRDPELKGRRWALLKDRRRLSDARRTDLDALLADLTTKRTAHAWQYREDLRAILNRKQINVVRDLLRQWCTNVMRSKVEPMNAVARMIRKHLEGIAAWARTRLTNGFLEALNGLFQAAKRKARLPPAVVHPHGHLPGHRKTRLPNTQPAYRLTHSKFKRASFLYCHLYSCQNI